MKKLILAIALLASTAVIATPIASKVKDKKRAQAAATLVKLAGYRCDSVDAFTPFIMSAGFNLYCNNYRYSYELADKGGKWVITVQ